MLISVIGEGVPINKTRILNSKFNMSRIKYNGPNRPDLSHKISIPPATPVFIVFTPMVLIAYLVLKVRPPILVHDSIAINDLDRMDRLFGPARVFYPYG